MAPPIDQIGRQPDGTYSETYRGKLNLLLKDNGVTWTDNSRNPDKIDDFELVSTIPGLDVRYVVQQAQLKLDGIFRNLLAETRRTIRADRKIVDTSNLAPWEKWALAKIRKEVFPVIDELGSLYLDEDNLKGGAWLQQHANDYADALWWYQLVQQDASPAKKDPLGATFPYFPDPWQMHTTFYPKDFMPDELPKLVEQSKQLPDNPHMDYHSVVRRAESIANKTGWKCSANYCSIPFNEYALYQVRCKAIATAFRAIAKGDPRLNITLPPTAIKMYEEAATCWETGEFRKLSQVFAINNQKLLEEGFKLVVFAQPVESYDASGQKFMTYGFAGIRTKRSEQLMSMVAKISKFIPDLEHAIEQASKGAYKANPRVPTMNNIFVEYADAASLLLTYPYGVPLGVNTENYAEDAGEQRVKMNLSMMDGGDGKHQIYIEPIVKAVFPKEYHSLIDSDHMQYFVMLHEVVTNLGAGPGFVTPGGQKANEALAGYWSNLDEATSDAGHLQMFYIAYQKQEISLTELKKAITTWLANRFRQVISTSREEAHSRGSQIGFGYLLLAGDVVKINDKGELTSIDPIKLCQANEALFNQLHYIRSNGDSAKAKELYDSTLAAFEKGFKPIETRLAQVNFPSQYRQVYE